MALADIEIKATMNEYRPCIVFYEDESHKALFHQWEVKEELLIKFKTARRWDDMEQRAEAIRKYLICQSPNEQVTKVRTLMALVEFEDGRIKEVEPTSVKFLDSKEKFEDYDWGEDKEEATDLPERRCETCRYWDVPTYKSPCYQCRSIAMHRDVQHSKWEERK